MRRYVLTFVLLLWCGWVQSASAQILGTGVLPVTEVGPNLLQNTITAIEAVAQTINMVLELTPVEEVVVGTALAEDLSLLGEVISSAQLLWYDAKSIEAQVTVLFGLDNVPDTPEGLTLRVQEIKQFAFEAQTFAMRTQTLLMTVVNTIDHVTRLVNGVSALVGNMQGNQVLIQSNATISKTLVVMEAQQAAWQRVDTVDRLSRAVIIESLQRIDARRWETWPRFQGAR